VQPSTPHAWGRLLVTCHSSSTGTSAWLCGAMPYVRQCTGELKRAECCTALEGVRRTAEAGVVLAVSTARTGLPAPPMPRHS